MRTTWAALLGFGSGLAVMYMLDPERGHARRAYVRDKGVHAQRRLTRALSARARDIGHRARGLAAVSRSRLARGGDVSDEMLVRRVRSEIGHHLGNSSLIRVSAQDGVVTLSGPVRKDEARALMACAKKVRGVKDLRSELSLLSKKETARPGARALGGLS
jgi:osmotically-inducible protein OsmY